MPGARQRTRHALAAHRRLVARLFTLRVARRIACPPRVVDKDCGGSDELDEVMSDGGLGELPMIASLALGHHPEDLKDQDGRRDGSVRQACRGTECVHSGWADAILPSARYDLQSSRGNGMIGVRASSQWIPLIGSSKNTA